MKLPGLPLAATLKAELAAPRANDSASPSAGGFAEQLARQGQDQGLRPPAAPQAARPPQPRSSSPAGAPAPSSGVHNTHASATTARQDPPHPPVAQAAEAHASNPASPTHHPSDAGPQAMSAARAAHAPSPTKARPATAQGGRDTDAGQGRVGAHVVDGDDGKLPDRARRATADAPVADAQAAPAQTPPPVDAALLAGWLAGWQPPAGGTDPGLPQAPADGHGEALAAGGQASTANAQQGRLDPALAWAPSAASVPGEGRSGAGGDAGRGVARAADVTTRIDARSGIANTPPTEGAAPVEDNRLDTAAVSTRVDSASGGAPSLPTPALQVAPPAPLQPAVSAPASAPDPAILAVAAAPLLAALDPGMAARLARDIPAAGSEFRHVPDSSVALRGGAAEARTGAALTSEAGGPTGRHAAEAATGRMPDPAAADAARVSLGLRVPGEGPPVAADSPAVSPGPSRSDPPGVGFSQALDIAALASSQGLGVNGAQAGTSRTEATVVALPMPVTDPAFREALGVQVSVLARDGVQSAELHLNPVDMGPISVRIDIDGHEAQVNFGVDHAMTRAIVEAGLPELATALREAGLTLTGGGVSDHGRSQGAGGDTGRDGSRRQDPGGERGGRGDDPAADPPPTPRRVRLPGAVDLYA